MSNTGPVGWPAPCCRNPGQRCSVHTCVHSQSQAKGCGSAWNALTFSASGLASFRVASLWPLSVVHFTDSATVVCLDRRAQNGKGSPVGRMLHRPSSPGTRSLQTGRSSCPSEVRRPESAKGTQKRICFGNSEQLTTPRRPKVMHTFCLAVCPSVRRHIALNSKSPAPRQHPVALLCTPGCIFEFHSFYVGSDVRQNFLPVQRSHKRIDDILQVIRHVVRPDLLALAMFHCALSGVSRP